MSTDQESNAYILGTDLEELKRLGLQHQVWASEAHKGWRDAGFSKGMTLLDLGSGPGFCTREMAKIVGNEGKVIAVDLSKVYVKYIDQLNKLEQLNIETVNSDFNDLELKPDSLDGMYCRWALAWISNPKEILDKVFKALKPGGKVVIHEYYDWMAHQINPHNESVSNAIDKCYQSFQDAEGDIDVGKRLPQILTELGFDICSTRPMSKLARPQDHTWQWPRSFYDAYWPKVQEMGYLTKEEVAIAFAELEKIEKIPVATLVCPFLIEIIAEKK